MNRKDRRADKKNTPAAHAASTAIAELLSAAVRHHQNGQLAEAEPLYRQILQADPRHADTLHLLGVLSHQTGRHEASADFIKKAIAQSSRVAPFHWSLGNALEAQSRFEQAAEAFSQAIALKPDYAEAYRNLGRCLQAQGKFDAAIACFQRALSHKPADAEAALHLGSALQRMGRLDEAAIAYKQALNLKPDSLEAHNNLGNVLQQQGRLDEAEASYRQVLQLKPDFAEVHNNLGTALREQGKLNEAIICYQQALMHKITLAEAHSNLLMTQHYLRGITNEALFQAALAFGKVFDQAPNYVGWPTEPASERRLRIGYISGDLCFHPVGYFLARVLCAHDKNRFEIFGYTNTQAADAMTQRLREACDHWSSIAGQSDEAAAALIRQDRIDILIDLSGHTARNRLPLFALRPAPLQVSWLGYFGTTGLSAIDYILMDAACVPAGNERWYSEKVVRLPGLRFCYDGPDAAAPASPPFQKHDGVITFGSFNHIAKINQDVVQLWADVLHATARSRLVLKWKSLSNESSSQRLLSAFMDAGIEADRLEFRGASPHHEMLAEYGDIDIALDPFPFCGGLTSCEALWMGVPVITLPGETPASRQTLGFLQVLNLADLAAASKPDYVTRAAALAGDHERLITLRQALRPLMAASRLCDGPAFTTGLETALREIWRRRCTGEPETSFDIA